MTTRPTKTLLAALLLALALPAAHAQNPADAPPAPPAVAPAPADTPPAPPAAVEATPPALPPLATASPSSPAPGTPPPPAEKKRSRFRIGPEFGLYLPTSSKARSEFGSSWLSLGLGLGDIGRVTPKGQTSFDLQILYQSRNGNHAFLAPVGVAYRTGISQSGANTAYVGAAADVYFADLRSGLYNVHSGIRTSGGVSVLIGENFGDSGFLEARYLFVPKIQSFDLSGLNLTAGYRF